MILLLQGYEISEEEINISLDEFKSKFTLTDGSIKYANFPAYIFG